MTAPGEHGLTSPPVPVGLVTYSVKPRGGVVHTLALAETLHAAGYPVRVIALGDPAAGFFRPVQAPFTIIQAPPSLPTLEERVFANVDALAIGLSRLAAEYPILHTQDCISARAACRVRDTAGGAVVIRTVHHVDDFTSPSLIDCQRQAILEPDRVLVVSRHWQEILTEEYGTAAEVVHNGVDISRFQAPDPALAAALRQRAGAAGRPLILAVGGIEPRKGSDTLIQAIASLRRSGRGPVLAIVGGHSFQDYREYRDRVLSSLPLLGLRLDDDVRLLGTVPDAELPGWYAAADVLAFPSTKEGWGLAVLEAMSAGLPVVVSDLPVFREYLRPGRDALMVPVNDAVALAAALAAVLDDRRLADSLRSAGRALCARFTWARSAAEHQKIYAQVGAGMTAGTRTGRVRAPLIVRPTQQESDPVPSRPPLPPFTEETARQKVQAAEDAWNTRDPERVAGAYSEGSVWRNRDEFLTGRAAIIEFLRRKWARELDYALRKDLWSFHANRIAVRFQYECRDSDGRWFRSYGNELWEFDAVGFMKRREASINDVPIAEADRRIFGPRPEAERGQSFPLR